MSDFYTELAVRHLLGKMIARCERAWRACEALATALDARDEARTTNLGRDPRHDDGLGDLYGEAEYAVGACTRAAVDAPWVWDAWLCIRNGFESAKREEWSHAVGDFEHAATLYRILRRNHRRAMERELARFTPKQEASHVR